LSNEIIDFAASSTKIVPHFHIPLQSGSDDILKAMRRKYDTVLYASRIQHIKEKMPNACIGVDVIVGFPGETDEAFLKTYQFLNELNISYLHVFPYSERSNTTANKMPGKVLLRNRNERVQQLQILSEKKKRFFYETQLGSTQSVLWEAENNANCLFGFTENYVKVKTTYDPMLINEITKVELQSIDEEMIVQSKQLEAIF